MTIRRPISVRWTDAEIRRIASAAILAGKSVSVIVREGALRRADEVLGDPALTAPPERRLRPPVPLPPEIERRDSAA